MSGPRTVPGSPAPSRVGLVGRRFPVLDDGEVMLVDVMGDDVAVVQAARVSYGAGTKTVREDRGLIRYLMRHQHTTPFEMCELKFRVRVPMDCWRQWIRHRTASVNEYSTRYSEAIDSAQKTAPDAWRAQASANKQGSGGCLPEGTGQLLSRVEARFLGEARALYEVRLQMGVAREQARKDLPLSTYTEAYWKVDLHNLLHFLALRMDGHAQAEIRAYATVIGEWIVAPLFPLTWEAFLDYRLHAVTLGRYEVAAIAALMDGRNDDASVHLGHLTERERAAHGGRLPGGVQGARGAARAWVCAGDPAPGGRGCSPWGQPWLSASAAPA